MHAFDGQTDGHDGSTDGRTDTFLAMGQQRGNEEFGANSHGALLCGVLHE